MRGSLSRDRRAAEACFTHPAARESGHSPFFALLLERPHPPAPPRLLSVCCFKLSVFHFHDKVIAFTRLRQSHPAPVASSFVSRRPSTCGVSIRSQRARREGPRSDQIKAFSPRYARPDKQKQKITCTTGWCFAPSVYALRLTCTTRARGLEVTSLCIARGCF